MENESELNPNKKETEDRKKIEIWAVDDNNTVTKAQMRGWALAGDNFGFKSYATAKEALGEIEEIVKNNGNLPNIIFVDGNLDKDEYELRDGANFIIQVRKLAITQPMLIAHSTCDNANQRMKEAGADLAMSKGVGTTLKDYLEFFKSIADK